MVPSSVPLTCLFIASARPSTPAAPVALPQVTKGWFWDAGTTSAGLACILLGGCAVTGGVDTLDAGQACRWTVGGPYLPGKE